MSLDEGGGGVGRAGTHHPNGAPFLLDNGATAIHHNGDQGVHTKQYKIKGSWIEKELADFLVFLQLLIGYFRLG